MKSKVIILFALVFTFISVNFSQEKSERKLVEIKLENACKELDSVITMIGKQDSVIRFANALLNDNGYAPHQHFHDTLFTKALNEMIDQIWAMYRAGKVYFEDFEFFIERIQKNKLLEQEHKNDFVLDLQSTEILYIPRFIPGY